MKDETLSVTIRLRPWVRPIAFCAAVLGFLVCLVAPKTGDRYTQAVIHWIMRVGIIVEPPKEHHHACACPKDCETSCTCSCGAVLSHGPTFATDGRWAWLMPDGTFEEWK